MIDVEKMRYEKVLPLTSSFSVVLMMDNLVRSAGFIVVS